MVEPLSRLGLPDSWRGIRGPDCHRTSDRDFRPVAPMVVVSAASDGAVSASPRALEPGRTARTSPARPAGAGAVPDRRFAQHGARAAAKPIAAGPASDPDDRFAVAPGRESS